MSASGTRIELRDLRLVREISRYASITRAATALHLSPSAASHRLAKLERNIGAVLFERIGKRTLATRSGQRLIELAEEMRHEWRMLSSSCGWTEANRARRCA
jgi:DNA-binding transcriptional LysR family regulator